ncbi:secretion system protein E, partial [Candidatus Bathyarchaeota archaeon]|nr:secretion system protein E [Candidatus Bathyarchaeota archaeon]
AEVVEMDPVSKEIITNEVFKWNPREDIFEYSGRSVLVDRIMKDKGLTKEYVSNELQRRSALIDWMRRSEIRKVSEVGKIIRDYYSDPDGVMEKVKLRVST